MKIAINGEIIDTENIYKIGNINFCLNEGVQYYFQIEFFNKKILAVTKYAEGYHIPKEIDKKYLKLSEFRDSIIKIWSENQSTIPQFNLE